jgi:hypothetical protein
MWPTWPTDRGNNCPIMWAAGPLQAVGHTYQSNQHSHPVIIGFTSWLEQPCLLGQLVGPGCVVGLATYLLD